jgi:hypothetical protein
MVHHDIDLYDLKIQIGAQTAVIDTTSGHLFWDVTAHRWVKAGALRYGAHLRTPAGGTATVLGGRAPQDRLGWMWDLTIPGDHDFYIVPASAVGLKPDRSRVTYDVVTEPTAVLVHNCDPVKDFGVPSRPGVYTIHTTSGAKYVGMSTRSMAERVAKSVLPGHAFTDAGYVCSDICNVTWAELPSGVSMLTGRRIEQTVMEGLKDQGVRLINRRDPEIDVSGMGSF